jgi:hypothetical protein
MNKSKFFPVHSVATRKKIYDHLILQHTGNPLYAHCIESGLETKHHVGYFFHKGRSVSGLES